MPLRIKIPGSSDGTDNNTVYMTSFRFHLQAPELVQARFTPLGPDSHTAGLHSRLESLERQQHAQAAEGARMGAPAVARPDATCELKATSYPKNKIKVLLLENISPTAVELFAAERFQVVRYTLWSLFCNVGLAGLLFLVHAKP